MVQIKETEEKISLPKRNIILKNISVKDLKLVDYETGEDLSKQVIEAIPFEEVSFKIIFEIPEDENLKNKEVGGQTVQF